MKIIGVETLQATGFGNLVWVLIHTDDGLIGLGETFRNPEATIAYVHETCAPFLLGEDPTHREKLTHSISSRIGNHFNGFPSRSVEVRGNSAVDMALWDLCGKAVGWPLYRLLGGPFRTECRIYNTCAGGNYNNQVRHGYNTELFSRDDHPPSLIGSCEDLLLQVYEPARLARELLDSGITAMKIWPFDVFALRNGAAEISRGDLRKAIWPIDQIRKEVGDSMDIMIEYHGLWRLPAALKIADALKATTSIGMKSLYGCRTSTTSPAFVIGSTPKSQAARTSARRNGIARCSSAARSMSRTSILPGSAGSAKRNGLPISPQRSTAPSPRMTARGL